MAVTRADAYVKMIVRLVLCDMKVDIYFEVVVRLLFYVIFGAFDMSCGREIEIGMCFRGDIL